MRTDRVAHMTTDLRVQEDMATVAPEALRVVIGSRSDRGMEVGMVATETASDTQAATIRVGNDIRNSMGTMIDAANSDIRAWLYQWFVGWVLFDFSFSSSFPFATG